jgi:hypothetical protein
MRKHRNPPALPADGTSAQLRARLWRFALASRDDATRASGTATIPFPEQGERARGAAAAEPPLAPGGDQRATGSIRNCRRPKGEAGVP